MFKRNNAEVKRKERKRLATYSASTAKAMKGQEWWKSWLFAVEGVAQSQLTEMLFVKLDRRRGMETWSASGLPLDAWDSSAESSEEKRKELGQVISAYCN